MMRRFDNYSGTEMYVSEYRVNGKYEWHVCNGRTQLGEPIAVAEGSCENLTDAILEASEIYERTIDNSND